MSDLGDEYEAGDINRVDDDLDDDLDDDGTDDGTDGFGDAGDGGNVAVASTPTAVLQHLATALADEPDAVVVDTEVRGRRATLRLHVAQPDMGRVIGRRGRTAQAIRALVAAAGAREGLATSVDIVD